MRTHLVSFVILALLTSFAARLGAAQPKEEPLVTKVQKAIDQGKKYLYGVGKNNRGNWEVGGVSAFQPGGQTCLATLALLHAGVPATDPLMKDALTYIRALEPKATYVVSLQTMVLAMAGEAQEFDKDRIQRNVDWLLDARVMRKGRLVGWGYGDRAQVTDNNSNTQYVLLGLHEGMQAGAKVDAKSIEEIRGFYIRSQRLDGRNDGAWGYRVGDEAHTGDEPRLTMTTAGLCGLLITGMDLNKGRELKANGDLDEEKCGVYEENLPVVKTLAWLAANLPRPKDYGQVPNLYYYLYGIERAGRLSGSRFIGEHDWYREGCDYLVAHQANDGGWSNGRAGDAPTGSVVNTCFSLLFLSKGRTPILISKLAHEGVDKAKNRVFPRNQAQGEHSPDWNNDRNDVRHLVDFASKNLFKRLPLGWQYFDGTATGTPTVDDLTEELLQSPIAYISGHYAPRFKPAEVEMLRKYVEEGGFILAEACCGRTEFDKGFREFVEKDLFPGEKLKKLDAEHPVYRASGKYAVPATDVELWGLSRGCRTVIVYCPQDLSCQWESMKYVEDAKNAKEKKAKYAFEIGANIIAYATGLEPPLPRLAVHEVSREGDGKKPSMGYLKVAQIKHGGDWQPAPRAMPNLMRELAQKRGAIVSLQTEELSFSDTNLVDFKMLYMHGRNDFSLPGPKALDTLRFNLKKGGGLLLADACCGPVSSKKFDEAFRKFIKKLFDKDLEPIPLKDPLFGEDVNGKGNEIRTVRCRRETPDGKQPDRGYQTVEPALEGIKIDGRWVVIYSKYDLGCALEKTQSTDCLGHDYDSAVKLAGAAVLYGLKH